MLGALGAFAVGVAAEKRAVDRLEYQAEKDKLGMYSRSITQAEIVLQQALTQLVRSRRLLNRISKLEEGGSMLTLPRSVTLTDVDAINFRNTQLFEGWFTMVINLELTNQLIDDFTDSYNRTYSEFHKLSLRGASLNSKVVKKDISTLKNFANDTNEVVESTIETFEKIYATVLVHAEMSLSESTKVDSIKALNSLRIDEVRIYEKIKEIKQRFKEDKMNA